MKQKRFRKVVEYGFDLASLGAIGIFALIIFMSGFLSGADGVYTAWYNWAWFPILEIIIITALYLLTREVHWEEEK